MVIVEYEFLDGCRMTKNVRAFCRLSEKSAIAKVKKYYSSGFEKFKILSVKTTNDKAKIKSMIGKELDDAMFYVDGYYGQVAEETFALIKALVNELAS